MKPAQHLKISANSQDPMWRDHLCVTRTWKKPNFMYQVIPDESRTCNNPNLSSSLEGVSGDPSEKGQDGFRITPVGNDREEDEFSISIHLGLPGTGHQSGDLGGFRKWPPAAFSLARTPQCSCPAACRSVCWSSCRSSCRAALPDAHF